MENIFIAKDIKEKLKYEHELFKQVFTNYNDITIKDIKTDKQGNIYAYISSNQSSKGELLKKISEQNVALARILKEVEK